MYRYFLPYIIVQKLFARFLVAISNDRQVPVDESHPSNRDVLSYMKTVTEVESAHRSRWAPDYYARPYEMATDVDLDNELEKMGKHLPEYCYSNCYGYPILVHPSTGVIFAVAYGSVVFVVRLPRQACERAKASKLADFHIHYDARFGFPAGDWYSTELGEDWIFTFAYEKRERMMGDLFLAAYNYAGELGKSQATAQGETHA